MACLALIAVEQTPAQTQTVTPDLFRPQRDGFQRPQDSALRKTAQTASDEVLNSNNSNTGNTGNPKTRDPESRLPNPDAPAPSRIGKIPTYGLPAATGASDTGYDSLNRKRKKPKYYPGQKKPKPAPGPGTPVPLLQNVNPALPPPRLPLPPSSTANRTPVPPSLAGTVIGQPYRKRLKIDEDPFGAVGDYAGSFLVKTAVEFMGGYDTNPGRTAVARGSPLYVVAPEFVAFSDWERHALVVDLRGSFTGYTNTFPPPTDGTISSAPTVTDRPNFDGHIDGRLDVSHDTRLLGELRLRAATDNPGSPNVQAGLAKYPIYTVLGTTLGIDQTFNRLQISAGGTFDRTMYQDSKLTNGVTTSNQDRDFNQYGGIARVSYDVLPGLKPFAEVQADTRVHDLAVDRNGYRRDSDGGYVKAGTSFEFTRLITGEASIGYAARTYTDPRLRDLTGLLTSASLVWAVTPLTTAKVFANTSVDETTLPGVSGTLTRTYTAEVDHDFRRWLTGIGKFTFGTLDYQGSGRLDKIYSISGDLIYKLNRNIWIKGTVRRDWLDSNLPGNSTASTVVMLGVRLQH